MTAEHSPNHDGVDPEEIQVVPAELMRVFREATRELASEEEGAEDEP
jgi:hypothetical protein